MNHLNRRNFISGCIKGALSCSAASLGASFALSGRLLAQTSSRFSDNKALVCIFLYGGNDSHNLLVPTQTASYSTYASVRQNLAHARDTLLPLSPKTDNAYGVGMPEQASSLHQLFESEKLAIVANLGPMVAPATKQALLNDESLLPPQLFSHNDQQSLWQTADLNTASTSGWGGRAADLIADTNDSLPMNITLFGNNVFQSGQLIQPISVDESGPETFAALDPNQSWNRARSQAFARIMEDVRSPLERAYRQQIDNAAVNNQRLLDTLDVVSDATVTYPANNPLSGQLQMVARLIAGQSITAQPRQIYHVGMGGWDTHDNQAQLHPQLLATLGAAMQAFQADLDSRGLTDNVTTFTLSEFGRTMTSNGDGTDHGWSGHQLVMGGAVNGRDIINRLPALALNSDDDLDDGRMIPTLSIEQYGADLMRWFGLSESELAFVFPYLSRFDGGPLGLFS